MCIKHVIGLAHRDGVVDPLTSTATFADSQEGTDFAMLWSGRTLTNEVLIRVMLKSLGHR